MITAENLITIYARNLMYINDKTKEVTQAESLLQPSVSGNCMNWIVGHITAYRNRILNILGDAPVLDPKIADRYQANTPPVLGPEAALGDVQEMVKAINLAQERIAAALRALTPERATEAIKLGSFNMTRAEWMLFLLRHEAYHTGQLELPYEMALAARKQ